MFTRLEIEGFRGLARVRLDGLTRVNLIVGRNGAGKTTALEAVEFLASGGGPGAARRRFGAARAGFAKGLQAAEMAIVLKHLFSGLRLQSGAQVRIRAADEGGARWEVEARLVGDAGTADAAGLREFDADDLESFPFGLDLWLESPVMGRRVHLSLAPPAPYDWSRMVARTGWRLEGGGRVRFVDAAASPLGRLLGEWNRVALTDEETHVVDALRIVAPEVERIALVRPRVFHNRAMAMVRLRGHPSPVALEALGEGAGRLLAIALGLAATRGGILLVDEIDTGLHHSALARMWRMVLESARRLDVQVFATTHSLDCLRGLGALVAEDEEFAADVSVHRVDPGRPLGIRYSGEETAVAVEQDIEVRGHGT